MVNEILNIRYKAKVHRIGTSYFLRIPKELITSNNLEDKELMVRLIVEEIFNKGKNEKKERR